MIKDGNLTIPTPKWAVPLLKPARYKGIKGGRGSGKSHERAEALIEEHIMNPEQASVCIREIQRTLAQSMKRLIEQKIITLGVERYFDIQDRQIRSNYGSGLIIFEGMQNHNADSIKSLEGFDRALIEEAQTLSQRSLDLLRPTIRKPHSEIWGIWNPQDPTDPIDALLCGESPPPDSIVLHVNYNDNPWFPDVLREEMEYDKRRDPEKYRHVWEGGYLTNSEARVFKNWVVDDFESPHDAIHRFGADWGFASDPTVLVRSHIIGRRLYVDYEAHMVGCDIIDIPTLFHTVPDSERWPIVADSARPETISHVRKHGFPKIMAAVKGGRSLEDGVEWLQSYDIVVHPRCQHVIDELTHYSYKRDPLTDKVLPILEDKHNHCIDALRYACESVRRNPRNRVVKPVVNRPIAAPSHASWMGS